MTNRIPVGVFFALFTVSGFAGLIYQSIWSHYLKLFLGHAAYAQTLVLAIFMGGMAMGSWLVSRYTGRIRDLLLGYAIAELGIGLLAVVFHGVFTGVTGWAFETVLPAIGGSGGVDLFKWTLASALILPASILLGTTFPLMSAGLIRLYPQDGPRALAMLYFTNSFGAAFGVLASGFVLIEALGLPGTILTAGIMNVLLAFAVWSLTKRLPAVAAEPARAGAGAGKGGLYWYILAAAFATGAASFIYEITWVRMLVLGLGASTHAFEVMLAAFILGIALGGFLIRNRMPGSGTDLRWLAVVLIGKGLLAMYAIFIYGSVLDLIVWLIKGTSPTDAGYALFTGGGLVASMIVMLPTAVFAGMSLPLATHALVSRGHGEASIGAVYAANTAGCILGAAFTTHVGMEAMGLKGLTGLGAFIDIAMAIGLLAAFATVRRATAFASAAAVAVAGVATYAVTVFDPLRMSSGVFRYGEFLSPANSKILYYRDGKTATVSLTEVGSGRTIRTNGKPDASLEMARRDRPAPDEATMALAGALPLAYKPEAKTAAIIGFGSGLTTHTLLGSPNLSRVDTIEIEPAMVEAARFFRPLNARAYDDPRSKVRIEDAKTFFAANGERYDVIISEPSNPWVSGVSTLFSEEFYGQAKRYLKPDGLLVQWLHVYEINVDLVSSVFKALHKHFGDYVVYGSSQGDLVIVAAPAGRLPDLREDLFGFPQVASGMKALGFDTLDQLRVSRVGTRKSLGPLFDASGHPANSDYFPVLDQRASRSRFKRESAMDIQVLPGVLVPLIDLVDGPVQVRAETFDSKVGTLPPRLLDGALARETVASLSGGEPSIPARLPAATAWQYAIFRQGLRECRLATPGWVDTFADIVRNTASVLSRAEMERLLQPVAASPCLASLPSLQMERMRYYAAIGRRDAAAIEAAGTTLLARDVQWPGPDRVTFLTGTAMAMAVRGRGPQAAAYWREHLAKVPPNLRVQIPVRLVDAYLGGKMDEPVAAPPEPVRVGR